MKTFYQWLEAVATSNDVVKPPAPPEDGGGGKNEDWHGRFGKQLWGWLNSNSECHKKCNISIASMLTDNLKLEKVDQRIIPYAQHAGNGMIDLYWSTGIKPTDMAQPLIKVLTGSCDIWKHLNINYEEGTTFLLNQSFREFLLGGIIEHFIGGMIIDHYRGMDYATLEVKQYIDKHPELVSKLQASYQKQTNKRHRMLYNNDYGHFTLGNDRIIYLVGYRHYTFRQPEDVADTWSDNTYGQISFTHSENSKDDYHWVEFSAHSSKGYHNAHITVHIVDVRKDSHHPDSATKVAYLGSVMGYKFDDEMMVELVRHASKWLCKKYGIALLAPRENHGYEDEKKLMKLAAEKGLGDGKKIVCGN